MACPYEVTRCGGEAYLHGIGIAGQNCDHFSHAERWRSSITIWLK